MSTVTNPTGSSPLEGRLRFLLQDATLYGGAAAISAGLALITFPLLARHFTVGEFGTLDYFLVLGSFLSIFFIFGQDSAVARYFYEYDETETRQQLISQSLVFQLFILALLLPIFWMGTEWLTGAVISVPDRSLLFKIVLSQLPFLLVINFSQNLLKWTFARVSFLIMSLGYTLVQTGLLVVAVMIFDVGIAGVLMVSLATSVLFGTLGLFLIRKWLIRPKDFTRLREMLPFALPYGVICVAGAFSPSFERSLIDSLLGTGSLGLYAAGAKFAMVIGLLVNAFQVAWGPFSLSLHKQVDADQTYNWVFKLFALAACLAALTLTLFSQPLIVLLATDRYVGAAVVVFPLAMGLAIQAISWITEIGIGISKHSHLSLYANGLAVVVTLGGILLFTPIFGLLGVGLGVLVGHIAKAVTASWLAQQAYPLPWQYGPTVLLMTLTTVSGLASIWMGEHLGLLYGNLLLGGTIFLVTGVGWFILFSRAERIRLKALLMRRWALV